MRKLTLLILSVLFSVFTYGQNLANYTFSTNTVGSLDPMTGATTLAGTGSLVAGYNDDNASAVTNIGFNFYFMGNSYAQFSVNSNGQMRLGSTTVGGTNITGFSAGVPLIVPMAGDNSSGFTGDADPISYLVTGTAPNRILIVQWKNFQIPYNSSGTIAGNMQVWLYETTGKIEYVYGAMYNNSTSVASRSIFLSSSNTVTTAGYITVSATPTFTLAATPTTNTFALSANIANLYSAANGSRRVFAFTPLSTTPADPTTLTFTAVTASTITPNWVDNSTDESFYIVTRATDATFTQNVITATVASTTTATTGTAYNLAQTGLTPGTLYYYKIQAANEAGIPDIGLTGSQATTAGTAYYWVGTSPADFNTAANWNTMADNTGTARTTATSTDVLIVDGDGIVAGTTATITLAAAGTCGQLLITNNTNVSFQSTTTTTRTITINGGAGNDLDIPAGCVLNLTNVNPAAIAFAGTGNTGNISGTYNAASSTSNVITTTGGTSTLVTVSSTGIVNNSIIGNSGCLLGSVATLTFSNGSNYNLSGFTTSNGLLPLATWGATSNITITGGTTATGMQNVNQTFGNITYNSTTSTATMSAFTSGTTVIQGNLAVLATNTGKFRALTSGTLTINGNLNVSGGTFEVASTTGVNKRIRKC